MPTPRRDHAALLATLLACALASSSAQPSSPGTGRYDDYLSDQVHVSNTMIALLAAVIGVFIFVACSTIYLRHCTGGGYAGGPDVERAVPLDAFASRFRQQRRQRGLDAAVVETFPTMRYAEAKALRVGRGGALECAVCLSEFEDEERLTLLPKCSHAFHPDCIGQWLASHVSCPVCRCNLDPSKDMSSDEEPSVAELASNSNSGEAGVPRQDGGAARPVAVVIDVGAEAEEERRQEAMELQRIGSQRRAMRSRSARRLARQTKPLVRSHSTGHSLAARLDRDLERFTLRLPEHVRREMVAAGEHSLQLRRGGRVGEGSSRGGRSAPLGVTGTWQSLLARTFSGKLSFFSASRTPEASDRGEVSSPSSTRVRTKRVAAVDVADVPAKGNLRLDCNGAGGSSSVPRSGTVPHEAAAPPDEEKAATMKVRT